MKPHRIPSLLLSYLLVFTSACSTTSGESAETPIPVPDNDTPGPGIAKNVILFIGDGMGVSTATAIRIFEGQRKGMQGEENVLSFERFPHVALSKTYSVNQQVSESAGTATAMLTGQKTLAGLIGVSKDTLRANCSSAKDQGLTSALMLSESIGLSTGIVTTTRLTHATPAAAYANSPDRNWESDVDLTAEARQNECRDIASQLVEFDHGDGIEVAMGGGRIMFLPYHEADPEGADTTGGRQDNRNLVNEWQQRYPGGSYVWNKRQFDEIDPSTTSRILGLFSSDHMQYEADREEDPGGEPSLAQMTRLAIEILDKNPDGYFLLVEGGRIDHAHHENNAYRALSDGVAFADAVAVADAMTNADETLIIVTADHSHPLTIGGYATRGNPILGKVINNDWSGAPMSTHDLMDDGKPYTTLAYQSGPGGAWVGGERPDLSDVDSISDKAFIQHAGAPRVVNGGTHAGEDVAVYARGPGAEGIHGVMEQNEIFNVIDKAARLNARAGGSLSGR